HREELEPAAGVFAQPRQPAESHRRRQSIPSAKRPRDRRPDESVRFSVSVLDSYGIPSPRAAGCRNASLIRQTSSRLSADGSPNLLASFLNAARRIVQQADRVSGFVVLRVTELQASSVLWPRLTGVRICSPPILPQSTRAARPRALSDPSVEAGWPSP